MKNETKTNDRMINNLYNVQNNSIDHLCLCIRYDPIICISTKQSSNLPLLIKIIKLNSIFLEGRVSEPAIFGTDPALEILKKAGSGY